MSKYEPMTYQQTCGTCKYLDQSIILTSYPPQAYCTLFRQNVFVTNEKCLEDTENKEQKSNSLCDTCKIGDTCDNSDKGVSWANHTICFKHEWLSKEDRE